MIIDVCFKIKKIKSFGFYMYIACYIIFFFFLLFAYRSRFRFPRLQGIQQGMFGKNV